MGFQAQVFRRKAKSRSITRYNRCVHLDKTPIHLVDVVMLHREERVILNKPSREEDLGVELNSPDEVSESQWLCIELVITTFDIKSKMQTTVCCWSENNKSNIKWLQKPKH